MCKCSPQIKTPFCGGIGCEWPENLGAVDLTVLEKSRAIDILKNQLAEKDETITELKRDLEVCQNDYWKMTSKLQMALTDIKMIQEIVLHCIQRMDFRKPLFKKGAKNVDAK